MDMSSRDLYWNLDPDQDLSEPGSKFYSQILNWLENYYLLSNILLLVQEPFLYMSLWRKLLNLIHS